MYLVVSTVIQLTAAMACPLLLPNGGGFMVDTPVDEFITVKATRREASK